MNTPELLAWLTKEAEVYDFYSPEATIRRYTKGPLEGVQIEFKCEYSAPQIKFSMLKALSEMFGTDHINVDEYTTNDGGCDTCDYGSSYGHTLEILKITKGAVPELGTWKRAGTYKKDGPCPWVKEK